MKEEEVTEQKNAGPAGRHGASLLPASFLAGSWHERRVEESELRVERDNHLEVDVTGLRRPQTPMTVNTLVTVNPDLRRPQTPEDRSEGRTLGRP